MPVSRKKTNKPRKQDYDLANYNPDGCGPNAPKELRAHYRRLQAICDHNHIPYDRGAGKLTRENLCAAIARHIHSLRQEPSTTNLSTHLNELREEQSETIQIMKQMEQALHELTTVIAVAKDDEQLSRVEELRKQQETTQTQHKEVVQMLQKLVDMIAKDKKKSSADAQDEMKQALIQRLNRLQQERDHLQQVHKSTLEALEEAGETKAASSLETINRLNDELQASQHSVVELNQALQDAQAQTSDCEQRSSLLQRQLDEWKEQYNQLMASHSSSTNEHQTNMEQLRVDVLQYRRQIQDLETKQDQTNKQIQQFSNDISKLLQFVNNNNNGNGTTTNKLVFTTAQLQTVYDKIQSLNQQRDQLIQSKTATDVEMNNLRNQMLHIKNDNAQLKQQVNNNVQTLSIEQDTIRQVREELNQVNRDLVKEKQEREMLYRQLMFEKQQCENISKIIAEAQSTIRQQKIELQKQHINERTRAATTPVATGQQPQPQQQPTTTMGNIFGNVMNLPQTIRVMIQPTSAPPVKMEDVAVVTQEREDKFNQLQRESQIVKEQYDAQLDKLRVADQNMKVKHTHLQNQFDVLQQQHQALIQQHEAIRVESHNELLDSNKIIEQLKAVIVKQKLDTQALLEETNRYKNENVDLLRQIQSKASEHNDTVNQLTNEYRRQIQLRDEHLSNLQKQNQAMLDKTNKEWQQKYNAELQAHQLFEKELNDFASTYQHIIISQDSRETYQSQFKTLQESYQRLEAMQNSIGQYWMQGKLATDVNQDVIHYLNHLTINTIQSNSTVPFSSLQTSSLLPPEQMTEEEQKFNSDRMSSQQALYEAIQQRKLENKKDIKTYIYQAEKNQWDRLTTILRHLKLQMKLISVRLSSQNNTYIDLQKQLERSNLSNQALQKQIQTLTLEVKDRQDKVTDLQVNLVELQGELLGYENERNNQKSNATGLEGTILQLRDQITSLKQELVEQQDVLLQTRQQLSSCQDSLLMRPPPSTTTTTVTTLKKRPREDVEEPSISLEKLQPVRQIPRIEIETTPEEVEEPTSTDIHPASIQGNNILETSRVREQEINEKMYWLVAVNMIPYQVDDSMKQVYSLLVQHFTDEDAPICGRDQDLLSANPLGDPQQLKRFATELQQLTGDEKGEEEIAVTLAPSLNSIKRKQLRQQFALNILESNISILLMDNESSDSLYAYLLATQFAEDNVNATRLHSINTGSMIPANESCYISQICGKSILQNTVASLISTLMEQKPDMRYFYLETVRPTTLAVNKYFRSERQKAYDAELKRYTRFISQSYGRIGFQYVDYLRNRDDNVTYRVSTTSDIQRELLSNGMSKSTSIKVNERYETNPRAAATFGNHQIVDTFVLERDHFRYSDPILRRVTVLSSSSTTHKTMKKTRRR